MLVKTFTAHKTFRRYKMDDWALRVAKNKVIRLQEDLAIAVQALKEIEEGCGPPEIIAKDALQAME